MKFSFKKLFFILAFIFGLFAILVFAKIVLIPLSMALLISFILFPVVKKLQKWGFNKILSAFLSLLMLIILIGGCIAIFSNEIMHLINEMEDFTGKIMNTFSETIVFVNKNINLNTELNREELVANGKQWLKKSSGTLIKNTFSSTAAFIKGLVATIIFTFLFLIYSEGLTKAFVAMGKEENKSKISRMLKNIQRVGKQYLSGMFIMIIILGFANSIGLWIIGIDSPFLFGFLAAILSIIPYVGTTFGATIPVLYAFMSSDSL